MKKHKKLIMRLLGLAKQWHTLGYDLQACGKDQPAKERLEWNLLANRVWECRNDLLNILGK